MMDSPTILIVDDDPNIREVIRIAMETNGFQHAEASNGQVALAEFGRRSVDLIVLDIGMPKMDGFAFCKAIRAKSDVPILFLTARDEEVERILGFELGADDFVAKPFSPRELVLRVKAILARGKPTTKAELTHGALTLQPEHHLASLADHDLALTATEFSLLAVLMRHQGHVFDRNRLIAAVYGGHAGLSGRTVDSHIRNIRAKSAELGCHSIIETVHGVGVRLGPCTL